MKRHNLPEGAGSGFTECSRMEVYKYACLKKGGKRGTYERRNQSCFTAVKRVWTEGE